MRSSLSETLANLAVALSLAQQAHAFLPPFNPDPCKTNCTVDGNTIPAVVGLGVLLGGLFLCGVAVCCCDNPVRRRVDAFLNQGSTQEMREITNGDSQVNYKTLRGETP